MSSSMHTRFECNSCRVQHFSSIHSHHEAPEGWVQSGGRWSNLHFCPSCTSRLVSLGHVFEQRYGFGAKVEDTDTIPAIQEKLNAQASK